MKAILVINKAESCTGCMLGIYNKKWICLATNKDIDVCDRYNIPTWCPLKPMPKEEDIYEVGMDDEDTNAKRQWNKGWNACIEELEK